MNARVCSEAPHKRVAGRGTSRVPGTGRGRPAHRVPAVLCQKIWRTPTVTPTMFFWPAMVGYLNA